MSALCSLFFEVPVPPWVTMVVGVAAIVAVVMSLLLAERVPIAAAAPTPAPAAATATATTAAPSKESKAASAANGRTARSDSKPAEPVQQQQQEEEEEKAEPKPTKSKQKKNKSKKVDKEAPAAAAAATASATAPAPAAASATHTTTNVTESSDSAALQQSMQQLLQQLVALANLDEQQWTFITNRSDVRVCSRTDVDGRRQWIRGTAQLPCSAQDFVRVVTNEQLRGQWEPLVTEHRVLKTWAAGNGAAGVGSLQLLYTALRGVWPLAGRDVTLVQYVGRAEDTEEKALGVCFRSAQEALPAQRHLIRAEVLGAGFILFPSVDDSSCRAVFLAEVDLHGAMPASLAQLLVEKQCLSLNRILHVVQKQRGPPAQGMVFPDVSEVFLQRAGGKATTTGGEQKTSDKKKKGKKDKESSGGAAAAGAGVVTPHVHPLLRDMKMFITGGCWDVLSAKLCEKAGYSSVLLSGFAMSASYLGEPDVGVLTQSEVIDIARRVCRSVKIAVIIDGDTGHGGIFNVQRLVRELIPIGARGVVLEDQTWPKRCGHMEGKTCVPMEEHVMKIKAAVEARGDHPFLITARTDSRIYSIDEAIRRGRAYKEAGADIIFVEAPQSVEEIARVGREVPGPLVLNNLEFGKTPILPLEDIHAMGYMSVGYVLTGLWAYAKAMMATVSHVMEHGSSIGLIKDNKLLPFDEFTDLVGLPDKYAVDKRFAMPKKL